MGMSFFCDTLNRIVNNVVLLSSKSGNEDVFFFLKQTDIEQKVFNYEKSHMCNMQKTNAVKPISILKDGNMPGWKLQTI